MRDPNQKWTPEEEEAVKAGVRKHGIGKWSTILKDPEYSSILKSRSNINVKDKWRNIISSSSGPNQDDNVTVVDKSILEAIIQLKRPFGPDRKSILLYIEENFKMLPDMKRLVTSRLKYLTHAGTLVQTQHKYRISPKYMAEGATQRSPQVDGEDVIKGLPKIDVRRSRRPRALLEKEAASAAARSVAEAEFAIAEAQEAAREAEEAEAEAEAAHMFSKVVIQSLQV